ncbi:hypothetical protein GCM10020331_008230 [Ectobacillus funiculus]
MKKIDEDIKLFSQALSDDDELIGERLRVLASILKRNGILDRVLTSKGEEYMDKNRRRELKEEFKQIKTYMGVFQITNKVNGKNLR